MLGRLRMTTAEALGHYASISDVSSIRSRAAASEADEATTMTLENTIRELVQAKALGGMMIEAGVDGPTADKGESSCCWAFVCAMADGDDTYQQRIRTYAMGKEGEADCSIVHAALATANVGRDAISSADANTWQNMAGVRHELSNPVLAVLAEARAKFSGVAKLGCLVRIGVEQVDGMGGSTSHRNSRLKSRLKSRQSTMSTRTSNYEAAKLRLAAVASDLELKILFDDKPNRYFCFVVRCHGSDEAQETRKRTSEISTETTAYLTSEDIVRSVNQLANVLCKPESSTGCASDVSLIDIC